MRKLASIQRVSEIQPIEGRDRIDLATVEGWHVIVQKSEYNPGDLCVYVEIDSVLPERPEFEFLRSKKFRIKTMKMAGVISQGICFPLSILPSGVYNEGDDVTDVLGITKYDEYEETVNERPVLPEKKSAFRQFMFRHRITRPLAKRIWQGTKREKMGFPDEVAKTDETRIQNMPWILNEKTKEYTYEVREKIDGQSGTFLLRKAKGIRRLWKPYEFIVCSRNLQLPTPDDSSYWQVAKLYDIEGVLHKLIRSNDWVCIQGECIGPKIQGNPYKVGAVDLYCFNLIYPFGKIAGVYAEKEVGNYGLKWVPLIDDAYKLPDTVDEVLAYATDKSQLHDTLREGIVIRNYAKNISFKAVSPEYLLKHGK